MLQKNVLATGQFPANVALNYISFKTGHKFSSFINRRPKRSCWSCWEARV